MQDRRRKLTADDEKEIVRLREEEGLIFPQIAEQFGVSKSAVHSAYQRLTTPDEHKKRQAKYQRQQRVRDAAKKNGGAPRYKPDTIARERLREYNKKYMAKRRAERLEWLKAVKDFPCADCGGRFPHFVMDFDHRGDEIKLFNIGERFACKNIVDLEDEIAKCDLVCSNCHRIRTYKRRNDGSSSDG